MPRVVYRGGTYERVPSHSWLESEFEALVVHRSPEIFPRWTPVKFNADVVYDRVVKRPDLALIDEHYREWWVVEVELEHHSLGNHVLPQVEVFANGRYTSAHADWIADRHPTLDRERLRQMMLGVPPGVLVVVDTPASGWGRDLDDLGVRLSVVEPFRDANGEFLLRVNGHQPEPPGMVLTTCVRELARLWAVSSPAALPPADADDMYTVFHDGVPTRWHRVVLADAVMLRAERGDPFPTLSAVNLMVRSDGTLEFVEPSPGRRKQR